MRPTIKWAYWSRDFETAKSQKAVRLKALHRSGYSSVAGKVSPITAVKTGPGKCLSKRGLPQKLELRQNHHKRQ
jgi:hypothetical protein